MEHSLSEYRNIRTIRLYSIVRIVLLYCSLCKQVSFFIMKIEWKWIEKFYPPFRLNKKTNRKTYFYETIRNLYSLFYIFLFPTYLLQYIFANAASVFIICSWKNLQTIFFYDRFHLPLCDEIILRCIAVDMIIWRNKYVITLKIKNKSFFYFRFRKKIKFSLIFYLSKTFRFIFVYDDILWNM